MTAGTVAVVMLTHRDPPLVHRIIDRLSVGRDIAIVVHHDPRGPVLNLPRSSQIVRVSDPVQASWGSPALAEAVLRSLTVAYESVPTLAWALVISGQDYPCMPIRSMEDELAETRYDAFVRWLEVGRPAADTVPWQQLTRVRYTRRIRVPGSHRHVPFPRRPPFNDDLRLYVGDMWPNLSRRALEHVLHQRRRLARVERYLSRCQAPDEALIPTLLLNDSDGLNIANDRRRYIRWTPGASHPDNLLQEADAVAALESSAFFARKVDAEHGAAFLDRLDAAIQISNR